MWTTGPVTCNRARALRSSNLSRHEFPGVAEERAAGLASKNYDHLQGAVVCHAEAFACWRRIRRDKLNPVDAGPGPSVVQRNASFSSSEDEHALQVRVVGGC